MPTNRVSQVLITVSTVTLCACAQTQNFVSADSPEPATLGRIVVYKNGVAFHERQARVKDGTLDITVPADRVDDFLKSLTVRTVKGDRTLPASFPSRTDATGELVRLQVQVPAADEDVVLTYVTEAPSWKPSYRLRVLPDGEVHVEGWAIVDNTSGEDWNNVLLGVGSSSALSFRYDLWSVRQVAREVLSSRQAFAVAPPNGAAVGGDAEADRVLARVGSSTLAQHRSEKDKAADQTTYDQLADQFKEGRQKLVIQSYGSQSEGGKLPSLQRGNRLRNELIARGVDPDRVVVNDNGWVPGKDAGVEVVYAAATTSEPNAPLDDSPVGESLFRSDVPVSVARQTSVMVAMLNDQTDGNVVYVYDAESARGNGRYAFRAVRFTNPTDSTLEPGPMTVYGEGNFIGEGLAEAVPPRSTAVIPFALDRQIVVESNAAETRDEISKLITLQRGILTTHVRHSRGKEVVVKNRSQEAATVLVRHTLRPGWEIADAPENFEKVGSNVYLFEVPLAAGEEKTVVIREATPLVTTMDLRERSHLAALRVHMSGVDSDSELAKQVRALLPLHEEMAEIQANKASTERRLKDYRVRMDELHVQIVSLQAVRTDGKLMRHLKRKLEEISELVQAATIEKINLEERYMLARVELQEGVADLHTTFDDPTGDSAEEAQGG